MSCRGPEEEAGSPEVTGSGCGWRLTLLGNVGEATGKPGYTPPAMLGGGGALNVGGCAAKGATNGCELNASGCGAVGKPSWGREYCGSKIDTGGGGNDCGTFPKGN